ncbi:hypothetical protein [Halomicrococcus sp. NG-SE-24]
MADAFWLAKYPPRIVEAGGSIDVGVAGDRRQAGQGEYLGVVRESEALP